jgi:hypothetical protein
LLNLETNETENYCNAIDLGTNLAVLRLEDDSVKAIISAAKQFDYFSVEGDIFSDEEIKPDRYKHISFAETDDQYSFLIGIIPKRSGQFGLFPGNNAPNVQRRGRPGCQDLAAFGLNLTNAERNIEIYENFVAPNEVSDYERETGFFFDVLE